MMQNTTITERPVMASQPSGIISYVHAFGALLLRRGVALRALSYSAAPLDYFFRGKLEVDYAEGEGPLTVTEKNISGLENMLKNGNFELAYDAAGGTRKPLAAMV